LSEGGLKYAAFVEQELKAERDRRTNLEARAQTIITTSGTVVTLLAAVGAFGGAWAKRAVPRTIDYPLVVTVTMFTFAVLFAVLSTFIFKYSVVDLKSLERLPRANWGDSDDIAVKNITAMNVTTIGTLRRGNNKKVVLLMVAWCAQLFAVASLGLVVYLITING